MFRGYVKFLLITASYSMSTFSCKKGDLNVKDCFPNEVTYRQIKDKNAVVSKQPNGTFYIVEEGTIDTRLYPCNLRSEFQVDKLQIVVSGEVKMTRNDMAIPCCIENFIITKISK
jgi:hypothetical protein